MILAGVCIIAAAFFLLRRDFNTAFVIAVLGLVSWFLNYRMQMKEIIRAADLQERNKGEDSDEN
jgi:preprotein translocase subunit SecF